MKYLERLQSNPYKRLLCPSDQPSLHIVVPAVECPDIDRVNPVLQLVRKRAGPEMGRCVGIARQSQGRTLQPPLTPMHGDIDGINPLDAGKRLPLAALTDP